jgi:transposase
MAETSELALWRYSLIAPLLHRPLDVSLSQMAQELSAQVKLGPDGGPVVVSPETLLRWFRDYQTSGLAALERQPRQDRGKPRALEAQTMAILLDLAGDHPRWTVKAIRREAEKLLGKAIPLKPVYRFLKDRRSKPTGREDEPRHRPIGVPQVLWLADTWHGPEVIGAHRLKRKSYLIAILDDASRAVMAGQFFLRDDVASLLVVFRQAILARGLPHRMIVDNGSNYRSRVFRTACATLDVHLIHAPKEDPTWKARLERFFLTVRMQLDPKLPPNPTLADVNTAWARFLAEYHAAEHTGLSRSLGERTSPLGYYLAHLPPNVRYVSNELSLDELLLIEETRRVNADSTIRVGGRLFEVRAGLSGERVRVRFNPAELGKVRYRPLKDFDASFQEAFPVQ